GRGGEEVTAAIPLLLVLVADQTQVSFVHERGRLEGLTWLFAGELRCSEFAELVIDERQEFVGGLPVTLLDLRQDLGDVGHRQEARSGKDVFDDVRLFDACEADIEATKRVREAL